MANELIELSRMLSEAAGETGKRVAAVLSGRKRAASGLILDRQRIVTCDASIQATEEVQVLLPTGDVAAVSLLGRDPGRDLALLELVEPLDEVDAVLPMASGAAVGEILLTISRQPDTGVNAAMGVLSSASGPWRTWRGGRLETLWKLDMGPYPGFSGSTVVRADGTVLGMASANLARGAGVVIPAEVIDRFVRAVLEEGGVRRGYLGVGLQPVPQLGGMIVLEVAPESPSAQAGLYVGDVILSVGGAPAADFAAIEEWLEGEHIGRPLPVEIYRAGQQVQVEIRVGARPVAA